MCISDNKIGERLGWVIDQIYGPRNRVEFVKDVGLTSSGKLSNYIHGRHKVPQYIFDWLGAHTDINLHWLQTGKGDPWMPPDPNAKELDLDELAEKGVVFTCGNEDYSAEEIREIIEGIKRARAKRKKRTDMT